MEILPALPIAKLEELDELYGANTIEIEPEPEPAGDPEPLVKLGNLSPLFLDE